MWRRFMVVLAAVALGLVLGHVVAQPSTKTVTTVRTVTRLAAHQTVCIANESPAYFSDAAIRRDIPAWEQAANKDFAPVWGTSQVKIVLNKFPRGCVKALFVKSGLVQGALAYHTVTRGQPMIVVYTGTGDYYGYSNSVSFTHELFEWLADPKTDLFNSPWNAYPVVHVGTQDVPLPAAALGINEVCDPVEAYQYELHGVAISDFITPNWFHDQVSGGYDFMGIVQEPYTIARGGYAMFKYNGQIVALQNFRGMGRDVAGFLKGEKADHQTA